MDTDMLRQIARHMGECSVAGVCRDAADTIDRLRRDCGELYQVIGTMAEHCPDPEASQIVKALDNASDAANGDARRHDDLLPFVLSKPPSDGQL